MSEALRKNAFAREQLLSTAIRACQELPVQDFSGGQRLTFELNSVGILRFLLVSFEGTLNLSGGSADPAWSKKAPYNIFPNIAFRDIVGTRRVDVSAFMLQNLVHLNRYGYAAEYTPTAYGHSTAGYALPSFSGTGDYTVRFNVVVPIAYDEDDLRGALVLAVPNAKAYLEVTCTNDLNDATNEDYVTVGGDRTVALSGKVKVTQYYFNPEARGGRIELPNLDLMQIHEIREIKTTSNLAQGMEKLFSLPTGRVYHLILAQYFKGTAANEGPNTTDIDRVRFLYDGNTPTLSEGLQQYLWRIRAMYGRDVPEGLFPIDLRKRPWDSNVWGQLQVGLRLSAAPGTNPYMLFLTKSLYTAEQTLGGPGQ